MSSSSFSGIIEAFFQRNGGWKRIKGELAVYYWPRIAGKGLASKVEANRYRDGILYLVTENAALAHQITLMSPEIILRYRKVLGQGIIKSIKIKVGSTNIITVPDQENPDVQLDRETETMISACGEEIQDPQLAEKFVHFMQKSYMNQLVKEATGGRQCKKCGIIIENGFDYCPCCERGNEGSQESAGAGE
ncbi:MAG TPA: DciA family protein [Bacillota bacterium]